MEEITKITLAILGVIAAFIGGVLLAVLPLYFAWNAIVPVIFGLSQITFVQAIWLSVLCSCLFRSSSVSRSDITRAIKDSR